MESKVFCPGEEESQGKGRSLFILDAAQCSCWGCELHGQVQMQVPAVIYVCVCPLQGLILLLIYIIFFFFGHKCLFHSVVISMKWSESCSVMSDSFWAHGLYSPWNSPGQNTGVGGLSLLQGIFPTQGSNPGLLNCRRILYQLSHKGSPRIL